MNINNFINNDTFINDFYAFNATSNRPVEINWGGSGLGAIAGPTPFIDISKTFNATESGFVESVTHSITLSGKIFKPEKATPASGVGIQNVTTAIQSLETLFKTCPINTLDVICGGVNVYSYSGAVVKNMSFSKSTDNWVQSADYTIDLEYKASVSGDPAEQVESRSETWTIEPIDDALYTKFSNSVIQLRAETHNPNALAGGARGAVGGGQIGGGNTHFMNIPQFRVSRRLSAKGLNPPTGISACPNPADMLGLQKSLFLKAKVWAENQANNPFQSSGIHFNIGNTPGSTPPAGGMANYTDPWLYNHVRSASADVYNGTYEINDTWIAMPTGIPYIETVSIDASTDEAGITSVRVNGNIQGLQIAGSNNRLASKDFPFPSGSGTGGNIGIQLKESTSSALSATPSYTNAGGMSASLSMGNDRYNTAFSGWINDIKPFLYRRACMVTHSFEREPDAIPQENPNTKNPVYLKEVLLNVIPTSTSEGHDPLKGTISYSHEFNNKSQFIKGVLSENIRISNTAPANSVQETQILGRALGPLLFTAGTTNPRKSITVEIVVQRPTGLKATFQSDPDCPLYWQGYYWTTVDSLIQGHAPFATRSNIDILITNGQTAPREQTVGSVIKDSDSEDWNPYEGRYSRTVSWVYQQCTTDKFFLDH